MRVADGVEQFTDQGIVNWFLVETDEGPVAVDAGFPTAWKQISERAGDLRAIVLTHGHIDHLGFAPIAQRTHGTPVFVPEQDVGLSKNPFYYAKSERLPVIYALKYGATRRTYWKGTKAVGFFGKTVKDPTPYTEADALPGGLKPIFTPGHTKGHMALHLPDRDILFAGDAFVTKDPYTNRVGPRLVARAATHDSEQAKRSLDRIEQTGAKTVVTGHGEPWTQGAEAAAAAARTADVA
jgi:glyoxylase-like metal-dependent hydrolase (beta-lactamase superfamily II)